MARNFEGGVFLSFKTISFVVAAIGAVAVSDISAFAAGPTTTCPPAAFKCAFSAVESKSLQDPNNPGRPSVIIGYIVFDSSATPAPTVFSQENKDGALQTLQSVAGTCSSGTSGSPGTLDFSGAGGPTLRFVTTHSGAELRFLDTSLNNGFASETLGTCRQI
jgi:hypothetical protein